MNRLPEGLWPVMLTPYDQDMRVDVKALEELVNFYIDQGASGLFANCLSSEMYELGYDEQLFLMKSVVNFAKARVPVVGTCTFMGKLPWAEQVMEVKGTGIAAVVLVTSLFNDENAGEGSFRDSLFRLMGETGDIPLGLYECPLPYKRLLSSSLLQELALTKRFVYFKDTSCDGHILDDRLNHLRETSLPLFNANTPTALDSLLNGGSGISPISANFYPGLYARMFDYSKSEQSWPKAQELQTYLSVMDGVTRIKYPLSAKYFLKKQGININETTRLGVGRINYEERKIFDALFDLYQKLR